MKAESTIAPAFLEWLLSVHIPEMMQTGCFTEYRVVKLLEVDDTEGPTYAVQYFTENQDIYNLFVQQHAHLLRQKVAQKWGNRYIAFHTLMQVVK